MTSETKACPVCGETIKAAAQKCIHCDEFITEKESSKGWTGFKTKTLWDWMNLLIIPVALAVGGSCYLHHRKRDNSMSKKPAQPPKVQLRLIVYRKTHFKGILTK